MTVEIMFRWDIAQDFSSLVFKLSLLLKKNDSTSTEPSLPRVRTKLPGNVEKNQPRSTQGKPTVGSTQGTNPNTYHYFMFKHRASKSIK